MAYFVSVLRQRIANFEAKPLSVAVDTGAVPAAASATVEVTGVSINDLRKNLRDLTSI